MISMIFLKVNAPFPVTIRLLDPPLHEFLPHTDAQIDLGFKKDIDYLFANNLSCNSIT